MDPLSIVVPLAIVLASLTVHEAAHAWTADRLGDPTARLLGRVSFNPIVHIDPIGTILLPLIAVISGFPVIGWAKPVPVNMGRLRDPRRDFTIIAAAGPISNLLLALAAALLLRNLAYAAGGAGATLLWALMLAVYINVLLAFFNLIPVPPLDGGNVLAGLLPADAAHVFERLRPFGFLILYALLFTGLLSALILPPAQAVVRALIPRAFLP